MALAQLSQRLSDPLLSPEHLRRHLILRRSFSSSHPFPCVFSLPPPSIAQTPSFFRPLPTSPSSLFLPFAPDPLSSASDLHRRPPTVVSSRHGHLTPCRRRCGASDRIECRVRR